MPAGHGLGFQQGKFSALYLYIRELGCRCTLSPSLRTVSTWAQHSTVEPACLCQAWIQQTPISAWSIPDPNLERLSHSTIKPVTTESVRKIPKLPSEIPSIPAGSRPGEVAPVRAGAFVAPRPPWKVPRLAVATGVVVAEWGIFVCFLSAQVVTSQSRT